MKSTTLRPDTKSISRALMLALAHSANANSGCPEGPQAATAEDRAAPAKVAEELFQQAFILVLALGVVRLMKSKILPS